MSLFATRHPAGAALPALGLGLTACDQPGPTSTLDTVVPNAAWAQGLLK